MPRVVLPFPSGLGCEALVVVVVAGQHDVRARVVQGLPERCSRVAAVVPGAEARVVPVGERAGRWVGGEVRAQPALLAEPGRSRRLGAVRS